jgi:hypothetical protein
MSLFAKFDCSSVGVSVVESVGSGIVTDQSHQRQPAPLEHFLSRQAVGVAS